jgi:prolyl oligopeptidase
MHFKILACMALGSFTLAANAQMAYPESKKGSTVDVYHGTSIADPYRWLEDDNAEDTKAWVMAQNKITQKHLDNTNRKKGIKDRLTELWNYPKDGAPFKEGDYTYVVKNNGLQNQSIWYRTKKGSKVEEVFYDPNKLAEDGTGALGGISFSKNGKYAVISINKAGSDWSNAYVMDVASKKMLADSILWLKFSGFSWKGEDGFYYSKYPEPEKGQELTAKNEFSKIMYHKLGTPVSNDVLIFEDNEHPLRYKNAGLTEDGRFLILSQSDGTDGSNIMVMDTKDPKKEWITIVPNFNTNANIVDNVGDKLLVYTNDGAPNFKLVLVDPKKPAKENWKTVIPEAKEPCDGIGTGGGFLFASYLKDVTTVAYQYTYQGKLVRQISLPGIGTAGGFGAKRNEKDFYYSYTSLNTPSSIYKYNITTGASTLYKKPNVKFNPEDFVVKQEFVTSKDGAKVPIFIMHKKGMTLTGDNPTLMYAYGGFNIATQPAFSISNLLFVERGGVYVSACIRGGSEYGEAWHKAGMLEKKQNVFDDFIAVAEWLITNKYTSKDKLAMTGGSNGGLLIGACMTQRPDLWKVAVPQVGVLDMLRFHKFTVGFGWVVEYGSSDNKVDFDYLLKYSPLHNIKENVSYPATMVMTADHDDRVVPAHSFKFAATLQEKNNGKAPMLIRVESKAGHGAGTPTAKRIDMLTDYWSFIMEHLEMKRF